MLPLASVEVTEVRNGHFAGPKVGPRALAPRCQGELVLRDGRVGLLAGTEMNSENTLQAARNEAEYRLRMHNKVYELSDQVIRSRAVLHIVDRGRELLPGQEHKQRDAKIEGHRDHASVTSVQVSSDVAIRSYTPPSPDSGVSMIALDTTKSRTSPTRGLSGLSFPPSSDVR